jgi:cytochrome c biogenesis protein CcmG, thiol:disulfide interchange protein DsbE
MTRPDGVAGASAEAETGDGPTVVLEEPTSEVSVASGPGPAPPGDAVVAGGRRRRGRVPLISAIAVGCVTALLVAVLATSKSASQDPTVVTTPLQDKAAPNITGSLLSGGTGGLFPGDRGKWVLVNFFASWCVPCQQEQNDLVKFQNAHASGDAVIFGVRFDDPDVGPIEQMMNKSGAKWPIVDDPDAKINYSVTGPPESFLISPGGVVLVHIVGPITEPQLESLLNQAKLVVSTPTSSSGSTGTGSSVPGSSVSSS